jgi:hypothetical protein
MNVRVRTWIAMAASCVVGTVYARLTDDRNLLEFYALVAVCVMIALFWIEFGPGERQSGSRHR